MFAILPLVLVSLLANSFATEFSWAAGHSQIEDIWHPVALQAARATATGSEPETCGDRLVFTLSVSVATLGAARPAGVALALTAMDACGSVALLTLRAPAPQPDSDANTTTWTGLAHWPATPCAGDLSLKIGLTVAVPALPADLPPLELQRVAATTACTPASSIPARAALAPASSASAIATELTAAPPRLAPPPTHNRRALAPVVAISAVQSMQGLAHVAATGRMRRDLCSGSVPISSFPYTIFSNFNQTYYVSNMVCTWVMTAPVGAVVVVTFTAFSIESCCDYVFLSEGPSAAFPALPGAARLTGAPLPVFGPFTSSGNVVTLTFATDGNIEWTGFTAVASFRYICKAATTVAVSANNSIISPAGPGASYANTASCVWLVTAPTGFRARVSFTSFSTQSGADSLTIYDRSTGTDLFGVYSGSQTPPVTTATGTALRLVFTSDGAVALAGFEAVVTFTTAPPSTLSACTTVTGSVTQGSVTACIGTLSGANCTPVCNTGFSPVGSFSCYASQWSGSASCQVSPCFTAPAVPNADTTICAGLPSGSTCAPVCDPGYNRTGRLSCFSGTWSGAASCQPNPCAASPPAVAQGSVDGCVNLPSGTACTPLCQRGYSVAGQFTCSLGQWRGLAVCAANPCATGPAAVASGSTLGCAGTAHDATCAPTCNAGYTVNGTFLCTAGLWTGSASCVANSCSETPPPVANGNVTHCPGQRSCVPVCDSGYTAAGSYACAAGLWTGSPACQPSPCTASPPAVAQGSVDGCVNLPSGTACTPLCQRGYTSAGQFTCSLGQWRGVATCNGNACQAAPAAVASGSTLGCAGTASDATCAPTCDRGHSATGALLCTAGAWSSNASCLPDPCMSVAPPVTNGNVTRCFGQRSGSGCAPVCDGGYIAAGSYACVAGLWTGSPACQPSPCTASPPAVAQGSVDGCVNLPSGTACTPLCQRGYSAAGQFTCSLGQWRGVATCNGNACQAAPAAVASGSTLGCAGTASDATCTPTCDRGHSATGALLCTAGAWSGSAACVGDACQSAPPAVTNGNVTLCAGLRSGSSCAPVCNGGFTAAGLYACAAGLWTGSPACQPNPCTTQPPAIASGTWLNCAAAANGASCVPTCDSGFLSRGTVTCTLGIWAGSPTCTAVATTDPPRGAVAGPPSDNSLSNREIGLIIGLVVAALLALLVAVICYVHRRRTKRYQPTSTLSPPPTTSSRQPSSEFNNPFYSTPHAAAVDARSMASEPGYAYPVVGAAAAAAASTGKPPAYTDTRDWHGDEMSVESSA